MAVTIKTATKDQMGRLTVVFGDGTTMWFPDKESLQTSVNSFGTRDDEMHQALSYLLTVPTNTTQDAVSISVSKTVDVGPPKK
jgi:hypothetical protein